MSWLHNPFLPRALASAELGRMGERRAAWFYRLHGYRILARNVRMKHGEIDLVARRGKTIVIAEVKARQGGCPVEGWAAVNRKKREKLIGLADRYLVQSAAPRDLMLRYDIVSLRWTGRKFVLTHFPDAFRPMADRIRPWVWRA